jgi:AcrR family transcriptional regulator
MSSQNASASLRLPQRKRGQRRVAALLEAAGAVFAEKSYDAATMTEVAARAGSAIGSLYQFFPTKERLADALIAQYATALYDRLASLEGEAAASSTDEFGTRLFRLLIDFRADHPAFATLVEGGGALPARATELRQRLRRQIAAILQRKAPVLSEPAAAAIAVAVQQVMKMAVTLNAETALPSRDAALDELRAMLLLYLRARLDAD